MKFVSPAPAIFHLAQTRLVKNETEPFLEKIGAKKDNKFWTTDAPSDAEKLIEMAGRGCYRSWFPGMNANVTRVREGNKTYIENILKSRHGSVIEHAYDTFAIVGCSRVFTHEMVRHRLANVSQESLRFVRLDELSAWFPDSFRLHEKADELLSTFKETFEYLEDVQIKLANLLDLDNLENFAQKKKLTSAMRRLAPIGLATGIVITSNHRNWRHMIEARTSRHAEEEIRIVFADIAEILANEYPNIYQDARVQMVDAIPEVTFENSKI